MGLTVVTVGAWVGLAVVAVGGGVGAEVGLAVVAVGGWVGASVVDCVGYTEKWWREKPNIIFALIKILKLLFTNLIAFFNVVIRG